ncbi:hypothetical protein PMAYCL1PPCAC_18905, partial [Pristionchus mayeri]
MMHLLNEDVDLRASDAREATVLRLEDADQLIRGGVISLVALRHLLDHESSVGVHDSSRCDGTAVLVHPLSAGDVLLSGAAVSHRLILSIYSPLPHSDVSSETQLQLLSQLQGVLHNCSHCTADERDDKEGSNHCSP